MASVTARTVDLRRSFLIKLISGIAAATALFFAIFYLLRGESSVFELVFFVIAGSAVLYALVILIATYSYVFAASCFVCLSLIVFIVVALDSGRNDGAHYFLLLIGPILPLTFGARRPYVVGLISGLSVLAFLGLEFTLPAYIYHNRPWLPQIRNPFTESLDIDPDDIIFSIVMFAFVGILSAATFVSVRMAERAELALEREFRRSEQLLGNLLPRPVAARLKDQPDRLIADHLPFVTVLFADVVGFTDRAARDRPEEVVDFLNRLFGVFDDLVDRHGLEKIKTIGDAYMAVGGINGGDSTGHARGTAELALDMIEHSRILDDKFERIAIRIGINCGPAIAGVIGRRKPFFDVWGDTINVAARMESSGLPGRIQTTFAMREMIMDHFDFEERASVDIKGKGAMKTYLLVGKH